MEVQVGILMQTLYAFFQLSPPVCKAPRLPSVSKQAGMRNKAQVIRCNETQMLEANCRQFAFKEVHYDQNISHKAGVYRHCFDVDIRMLSQNEVIERQLPCNEKNLQAVRFIILVRSFLLRLHQLDRHPFSPIWGLQGWYTQ